MVHAIPGANPAGVRRRPGPNFTGAIYGCQRAAQVMVKAPQANQAILAVSSIRALGARPGRLIYAASKAA